VIKEHDAPPAIGAVLTTRRGIIPEIASLKLPLSTTKRIVKELSVGRKKFITQKAIANQSYVAKNANG